MAGNNQYKQNYFTGYMNNTQINTRNCAVNYWVLELIVSIFNISVQICFKTWEIETVHNLYKQTQSNQKNVHPSRLGVAQHHLQTRAQGLALG